MISSVEKIYSGFKVIEAGIFFMETSDYFSECIWSSCRSCSHIWHFGVTYVDGFVHQLWYMTGFQLFWVNRDGCHMWGRKCSLFSEYLISLPLGTSWFHPFIIYTLHNLSVAGLCLCINDSGLFAFVLDLFYITQTCHLLCLRHCLHLLHTIQYIEFTWDVRGLEVNLPATTSA